jgi:serine/threonine protein kinase
MKTSELRDDHYHRLSFLLKKEYALKVEHVTHIKPHVWQIDTDDGPKVLKGYPSLRRAALQIIFMKSLKQAGFQAVPSLRTDTLNSGIVHFDQRYWILQDCISPSVPFSFASVQDRSDGLNLLEQYHRYSALLIHHPFLRMHLPRYNLYNKWQERYRFFLYFLPFIKQKIALEKVKFIMYSADNSLKNLRRFYNFLTAETNSIIHGDVASHNFLRTDKGKLYLIDYDLIAAAPKSIDYLQYVNRILPHLGWSFSGLQKLPQISKQITKKWFLSALMFPADILREWNAAMTKYSSEPRFLMRAVEYTNSQFEVRKQFVEEIYDMVR